MLTLLKAKLSLSTHSSIHPSQHFNNTSATISPMPKKSIHPYHEEDAEADDEQGIKKPLSREEKSQAMSDGTVDKEPYDEEGREALRDDDEIDDWEEGFMAGATGKGSKASCANCGKPLPPKNRLVEKMVDGEVEFYCCSDCAADEE